MELRLEKEKRAVINTFHVLRVKGNEFFLKHDTKN